MIGKDRFLSWFWWLSIRLEPWIQFFSELTVMLNGFILLRILALGLGKFGLKKQKHGAPRAYWIGMIKATNAGNGKPHYLFNHSAPCFSILSFFFSWLKGAWIPKSFRWSRRLHSKMSNFKAHFRMHFAIKQFIFSIAAILQAWPVQPFSHHLLHCQKYPFLFAKIFYFFRLRSR